MKREKAKKTKKSDKPEKITAEESLARMKNFAERKEKTIAFISASKN